MTTKMEKWYSYCRFLMSAVLNELHKDYLQLPAMDRRNEEKEYVPMLMTLLIVNNFND